MSQGYNLVKRASKPGDNSSAKKYFAIAKSNGVTDMETLCTHISARSTVSSADVKAVLDGLNYILDLELRAGRIVQLGEFGNFRITLGSDGSDESKSFSSSMIRKPKITFTPGVTLQRTRNNINFQRVGSAPEDTESENDVQPEGF